MTTDGRKWGWGGWGEETPRSEFWKTPECFRLPPPHRALLLRPWWEWAWAGVGACRFPRDKLEYESAVQPREVPVSGVNTETHPETNTREQLPGHRPHTHAYTHAGRFTDVSATYSHRRHARKACSASESSSEVMDNFCSFCWRRSWRRSRDLERPSRPQT